MRSIIRFTLFAAVAGVQTLPLSAADASYFRDIRPVIQRQCQGCHQPNVKSSELDLTSYEALQAGGKRGPLFQAGAAGDSMLIKYLTGEMKPQMPMGQPALPAEQIELFRAWIAGGAKDDTPPEARETLSLGEPVVYRQPPVITAVAWAPDGGTLAVSGYREVLLHSLDGSAPPRRLPGLSERIHSITFSKDGSLMMAAGGTPARFGEVQFWDPAAGKLLRSITLTGDTVFGGSLSPDGSKAAVGCADNTVRILDVATGKELHKIGNHENWVLGTVFGGDGKRIVSVGPDRAAKLTDAGSGAFLENVNLLRDELAAVARHPGKEVVVIGGEDRIPYVYKMDRPKNMKIADDTTLIRQFEKQEGAIFALAWSPDGRNIAVAGAAPQVTIYDAENGQRVAACEGHTAGIYTVAFSPDSLRLVTGGFDGQVRIYSAASGKMEKSFVPVPLSPSMSKLGGQQ
ncbi:MAG: c-type cytochrome domain-containing protein [Bryobacteraceae bacterium]